MDVADKESCRPDFARALYLGNLWISEKKFTLNSDIRVSADPPPTFLMAAEDDNVDDVKYSRIYYIALKNPGLPAEMHLHAQGRHAFRLAAHDISGDGVASVGRDMAPNDRNDF